jgi:hypothetical protein
MDLYFKLQRWVAAAISGNPPSVSICAA